ncbi:MAG: beta-glucuronidase [Bacteroidales bacterium]|nr:beta-glucuronidase [Candidatus Cryptobacteroides faecihippi]
MKKTALIILALFMGISLAAQNNIPRPEYPRPQFERTEWMNLNGTWTYTFDMPNSGLERGLNASQGFEGKITVPFCPESELSGVGHKDFIYSMWYQRKVSVPSSWDGRKVLIHFGGVDWYCALYVNGSLAGRHWGGSASFEFDITRFVKAGEEANLVLKVEDNTRSRLQPGGKQSERLNSYGCQYTRITGIWQTVWMEAVAPAGLKAAYVKPDLDNSRFIVEPSFFSLDGQTLSVKVLDEGKVISSASVKASSVTSISLPIKKVKTWSPDSPFLYDIEYVVTDKDGNTIDKVTSYAGMRKIHIEGNRIYLNNKPVFLRLVLDQGFYPDGIWTAPSDEALKNDILMSQAVGFNGARLHQKVFEERFHYWADKLGYLTWGESSSWGFDVNREDATRNFVTEWQEIVVRDRNHPSIIGWTPFNETWARNKGNEGGRVHDRMVMDVYTMTHNLDYRPVNDVSGGYHVITDLWSYHDYNQDAEGLRKDLTLKGDGTVPTYDKNEECPYDGQPYFLDEYGGIKWVIEQYAANTWGYGQGPKSLDEFYDRIKGLTDTILSFDYISGFCYTQLTDVEQEQNGIYTYDRKAKFDAARLKAILGQDPEWAK